jgi:hypothetical protein
MACASDGSTHWKKGYPCKQPRGSPRGCVSIGANIGRENDNCVDWNKFIPEYYKIRKHRYIYYILAVDHDKYYPNASGYSAHYGAIHI